MSYRNLNLHPLNSLLRSTFARAAAGALGAVAPLAVLANPTGGQVVGGTATIGSAGANGLVITQGSQKAIINWQQFNVGSGQYVQFVQPNSSAVVLNRVTSANPSSIFGDILANGQVFLVNPYGVYFAPGASIDVGGLVASTLDLSNADFMQGRYLFSRDPDAIYGGVSNNGNIQVAPGGYVVLAGAYAKNTGSITAQTGRVVLAAGDAARLTLDNDNLISYVVDGKTLSRLAGVTNTGEITANGGLVLMTADVADALTATAVNNSGLITAHSVSEQGGEIVLEADGGAIRNSGVLDASGVGAGVDGGAVIVHATHGDTVLTPTSQIDAAGAADGVGGFVDVSGHELTLKGAITSGKGGKLLLDPTVVRIEGGGANSSCSGCEGGVIHTNFIQHELNLGINLDIIASGSIKNSGATAITATGAGKLALKIGTTHIQSPSGGTLHRITGSIYNNSSALNEAFTASQGGTINITGITVNIKGGFQASASKGTVKLGNVTASNISVTGEFITVGNMHATGTGGISIRAVGPSSAGSLNGGTMTADNGEVFISQIGGHTGISVDAIQAKGGVDVSGGGATGPLNLFINGNVTGDGGRVNIGNGNGNITVNGSVKNSNGDLSITARAGGASSHSGGNIKVTGNLTTLHAGNVKLGAFGGGTAEGNGGGNIKVGNIAAAGGVQISASYTKASHSFEVKTGTITAGNSGAAHGGISIDMNGAGATLKTGVLLAQGPLKAHCSCEGPSVRAGDVVINVNNNGGLGSVSVGGVKSLHGLVSISDAKAPVTVNGAITAASNVSLVGRTLNFGSITAVGNTVRLSADTISSVNHAAITQTAGTTITARFIDVDLNASYGGAIQLANLVASSSKGSAGVTVNAHSVNNKANSIVIGGNITVSGKGDTAAFSSAMPGGGAPLAAFVNLHASGSAAAAHPVTVTGNISVTAQAGAFNFHKTGCSGECGSHGGPTITATGTGGEALVEIIAENATAQIQGTTTLKGTDAELLINAPTIKTGAISVTGSGHTIDITVSTGGEGSVTLTSSNDIGHANVILAGSHGGATTITTGNVTASGKGSAMVQMGGKNITTGNISVTASAATGSRHITGTHIGSIQDYGAGSHMPGLFGLRMNDGTFTAGHAEVLLGNSSSRALSVTTGNISVTGVGEADINIAGDKIQTGSLNATAAAGKAKGSFSSSNETGVHHQKFTIAGGEANINLQTSSGAATAITVNGGVTATGPTADVNLFGHSVTVSKGITVIAKGGHASVSGSGTGGAGVASSFRGPGPLTAIAIGGVGTANAASINVGGVVSVKGPGVIGIAITGAKVTLGGISASASATAKYVLSRTGSQAINDTFTGGSVAVLVFDESGGAITGPAKINGNVTISAPHGDVAFGAQLNATGQVKISGMDIDTNTGTVITRVQEISHLTGGNSGSGGPNIPSSSALVPIIGAAGISMTATAGNVDLTGATLTTPATGVVTLKASRDIILSGVTINVGTFSANAGSTIHNGGATGTLTANGLALTAGKDITLSSTQITVGKGSVASLASDPTLLQALAAAGLSPNTPRPNAYFNAGGTLTLAKLTLTGDYMYLQGGTITMLGPISTPADSVVQFVPTTGPATIGVEQNPGTGSVLNLSNSLLLSLFPGTTLVLGNGSETGAVTLGNNGTVNIGSSNLIVDTTGTITGLDNIISTGLVSSVESLLASALAPPTPSEIDPNSTNNNNAAGKHHETGDEDPNAGVGGGTISQTSDAGGACH